MLNKKKVLKLTKWALRTNQLRKKKSHVSVDQGYLIVPNHF